MADVVKKLSLSDKETTELQGEVMDELSLDIDEKELSALIDKKIEFAKKDYDNLDRIRSENENYWLGKQIDRKKLRDFQSRIIENVIFQSVETIIPIITSKPPEPVVQSAQATPESAELAQQIQKVLLAMFDEEKVKGKFQMITRHLLLYRLGVLKYKYDPEVDEIKTEWVRPQNIIVDKYGDFVAEYLDESISDILEKFPEKVDEIVKIFNLKAQKNEDGSYDPTTIDNKMLATKIKYIEFWTDEYVCWKYKSTIFKKLKNPNFDYRGIEKPVIDENGEEIETELYFYNFFEKPKKPYIFYNCFNLGKTLWDDVSLVEQGMPLQDGINKRQRQIDDNASDNGVIVGSGDFITKEELGKYTGDPGDKLWVEHGNPNEGLARLPAKQMPNFIPDSLIQLRAAVDNVLGTHSTTRGERQGRETLGGRQILKQADFGRIDLIVRGLEQVADELYKAWMHMIKVYYTQEHYARILGKDGATQVIQYSRDHIEDGIEISVKEGSTLPVDKVSQREEVIELAQLGQVDPITLFEKLEWPNPVESAKRLFLWKTEPLKLFPDLEKQIAEEMAQKGEQAKKTEQERHNYTMIVKMETLPPQVQEELLKQHFDIQSQFQDPQQVAQEEIQRINSGENVPPYPKADQTHIAVHEGFINSPQFDSLDAQVQALHQVHTEVEKSQLQQGGGQNDVPEPSAEEIPMGQETGNSQTLE